MIKLSELQVDIYEILKEKPITRTDDQLLYVAYWSKKRPDVSFLDSDIISNTDNLFNNIWWASSYHILLWNEFKPNIRKDSVINKTVSNKYLWSFINFFINYSPFLL